MRQIRKQSWSHTSSVTVVFLKIFDKCWLRLFPVLNKQLNQLFKYSFIELTLQYTECLIDFKLVRCTNL